MGKKLACSARWGGETSEGTAELETDYVLFRGGFRVKLGFSDITSVTASKGRLVLASKTGRLELELGPDADRWADKILDPPSVLDKIGLKEGMRTVVLGPAPTAFAGEVEAVTGQVPGSRARKDSDALFMFSDDLGGLERIVKLPAFLKPAGALWVVYPKGRKDITENDVLAAGRDAGLKDVKVVRFSETHTALKFVIPKDQR